MSMPTMAEIRAFPVLHAHGDFWVCDREDRNDLAVYRDTDADLAVLDSTYDRTEYGIQAATARCDYLSARFGATVNLMADNWSADEVDA